MLVLFQLLSETTADTADRRASTDKSTDWLIVFIDVPLSSLCLCVSVVQFSRIPHSFRQPLK